MRMQSLTLFFAAGLSAVFAVGLSGPARSMSANSANYLADSTVCRQTVRRTEQTLKLPIGILQAISLAESGRWDKSSRSHFAWPWTVTARGKGLFYPSKASAIAAVRKLQADGVENIDVGCMQVNLKYHPKAFANLEEAFDPAINARYAADLFTKLRVTNRSINRAVAHYHSTTRERNIPYTRKVMRLWNQERRRHFAEVRQQKLSAWHAERQRRERTRQEKASGRRAENDETAAQTEQTR